MKERIVKGCLDIQNKRFGKKLWLFAVVLSYMNKDNVVTLEVKVFAGISTKCVIKNTEKLV